MATRTITTRIALDGERDFKAQMAQVNGELRNLKSEMTLVDATFRGQANTTEALTAKHKVLRGSVEQQRERVRALTQAVEDATQAYGDNDKRTDGYRQSLNRAKAELADLNRELQDNERYLDEAGKSADGCAESIDEYGKAVRDADGGKDPLGNLMAGFGNLKGVLAGGAVVGGIKAVGDAIMSVVEDTAEYRKIMGTLEISSERAGYSAQQTADIYRTLQGVLGDTQTAATTTANLQAIGLSQEDLITVTNAAIGAWATYGDSIPIDGLSESINETIQAGKVTGTFADVLNWAGTSEDDFNAKLEAANGTTERANIVLQELKSQGLDQAGKAWQDANEDVVALNEATERWDGAMAQLGETLTPAATAIKNFGADAIIWLADQIQAVIEWWNSLVSVMNDPEKGQMVGMGAGAAGTAQRVGEGLSRQQIGDETWQRKRRGVNGTYAMGLERVPWDGFVAEVHKDEAILTASEAAVWRELQRRGSQTQQGALTAQEYRGGLAAAVNAINSGRDIGTGQELRITLVTRDGRAMAEWLIDDIRQLNKSNPEVVSDF
uniref:Minor tail protein n=1 Tax=Siphoviridae sp. ct4fm14 TaxID=2825331 RepID=A0A8S5UT81_9CAUD|nr:MAG TPA: minor tail protein [Siphoviridae sp. ct4fm14]